MGLKAEDDHDNNKTMMIVPPTSSNKEKEEDGFFYAEESIEDRWRTAAAATADNAATAANSSSWNTTSHPPSNAFDTTKNNHSYSNIIPTNNNNNKYAATTTNNNNNNRGRRLLTHRQPTITTNTMKNHHHHQMKETDATINDNNDNDNNNFSYNNNNHHHHQSIHCYCLPCISCGKGEQGRSNIRLLTLLLVPILLLSLFLMDDVYHVLQRNAKLRAAIMESSSSNNNNMMKYNGASGGGEEEGIITSEVLRRKVIHEYPGIHREILWIPLERTLTFIDSSSSSGSSSSLSGSGTTIQVKAKLACPRGILFLFHGCGRYAASFFYSPQGRQIVSMAYQAGVAVVAFKKESELFCWDWEKDGETVLKLGKKFLLSRVLDACGGGGGKRGNSQEEEEEGGEKEKEEDSFLLPPLWGYGVSSGGSFVSMLAMSMSQNPKQYQPFLFSAMNIQIINPPRNVHWDIPTIFTVMEGDEMTKMNVEARVQSKLVQLEGKMDNNNINTPGGGSGGDGPFQMIVTSGRKGIHPNHFHRLYGEDVQMSGEVSHGIYQEMVRLGMIDPNNSDLLTDDPRQMSESIAIIISKYGMEGRRQQQQQNTMSSSSSTDILPFGVSHQIMRPLKKEEQLDADTLWLTEELNVAWDVHEITAEGFDRVLDFFFEYGMRSATTPPKY